jgi:hypothetical protein
MVRLRLALGWKRHRQPLHEDQLALGPAFDHLEGAGLI